MEESKLRKILLHEYTIITTVASLVFTFVFWVILPINTIQLTVGQQGKDIATINTNHLTHLQNYAEEIKELKADDTKIKDNCFQIQLETEKKFERILTLLEK